MLMSGYVWSVDIFDRVTGEFTDHRVLESFSDDEALETLALDDLGAGDVYDLSPEAVNRIAARYGIAVDQNRCEYLLARAARPKPTA